MAPAFPTTGVVYVPHRSVLSRILFGLGFLALGGFGLHVLLRAHDRDWTYFHDVFPVHLLLAGLIAAYLPYLSFMLFHSLAAGYVIRRTAGGLVVEGEGKVHDLRWEDIRQVRFGDLYLKLETTRGRIEVPFIRSEDQREIYRCHHRAVGFRPDAGRFLATR